MKAMTRARGVTGVVLAVVAVAGCSTPSNHDDAPVSTTTPSQDTAVEYAWPTRGATPMADLWTVTGDQVDVDHFECGGTGDVSGHGVLGPQQDDVRTITWAGANPLVAYHRTAGPTTDVELDERHLVPKGVSRTYVATRDVDEKMGWFSGMCLQQSYDREHQ